MSKIDHSVGLERVRRFIDEDLLPRARRIDDDAVFPSDLYRRCADRGILTLGLPEEYGGSGEDPILPILACELIARASPSFSMIFSMCADVAAPIITDGTPELKRRYLPGIMRGDIVPCICISEKSSGSDAAGIDTQARREGDFYVVSGEKEWVTSAAVGSLFVILAKTDPAAGHKGVSILAVDRDLPGITVHPDHDMIGFRASRTAAVTFDRVRVPVDRLIGLEGEGFAIAMKMLDKYRLSAAGIGLGIASASLYHAVDFASSRTTFGKPLIQHEGIQVDLSQHMADLTAARSLWEKCVFELENPRTPKRSALAGMAKLVCGDVAMRLSTKAVQLHGAIGLTKTYPVEMLMRDAKVVQIIDGTSEIQRLIIGRYLAKHGCSAL